MDGLTFRYKRQIWSRRLYLLTLAIILALAPGIKIVAAGPPVIEKDSRIQALIDQITEERVRQAIESISGETEVLVGGEPYTLMNRNTSSGEPIVKATQYMYEQFSASGLQPAYHVWNTIEGYRSVLADQAGFSSEGSLYLVTSHIDLFGGPPAYGADDNASGTAAVLIASQVLSQSDFSASLRYIAFTGEELGLLGSGAYAALMDTQGAPIRGVVNLDMIAYNTPASPRDIDLHIRQDQPSDLELADLFSEVVATYKIDLIPEILPDNENRSDHYPFWQHGFSGVFGSEDMSDFSPYYHKATDRVSTLDIGYATSYFQAVVGTLAHLAGLVETIPLYIPILYR